MKKYYVYMLASKTNSTLYIGITSHLAKRIYEHRAGLVDGFTKKYNVRKLVYFEEYTNVLEAIAREKQIKKWLRQWKIELIEKLNPKWKDLYFDLNCH
jgi:putative endonuclease